MAMKTEQKIYTATGVLDGLGLLELRLAAAAQSET